MTKNNGYTTDSFLLSIIKHANSGICVCHELNTFPYVRFTVWNDQMVEITGYSISEINEKGWYQSLYPNPEIQKQAQERMARMRAGENMEAEEWKITRSDSIQRRVSISTSIIASEDGVAHVLAIINDITAQKQEEAVGIQYREELEEAITEGTAELDEANLQLKRLNESLEAAQDMAGLGYWTYDIATGMPTWSRQMFAIFGVDSESGPPQYDDHKKILHPDDFELFDSAVTECIKEGTPYNLVLRVFFPDRSIHFVQTQGLPRFDTNGSIYELFGTSQDITEKQKIDQELKERQKLYSLFDTIPAFIYLQAPDYTIRFANRYFREHFGEPKRKLCYEVLWGREQPCEVCPTFKIFDTGKPQTWEWEKAPDGRSYEISDHPYTDTDGTQLVFEVGYDITERKQAEEALKKNQRLLLETERIGKVGGWEFFIDTGKQTWTEEIYRIHEVDRPYGPTVGKGINFYSPASRPIIEQAVQRAIVHGEPFDLELEIITAKGNLRSVHTIGKADPKHRRIYGFFQDITERKRAEDALRLHGEIMKNMAEGVYLIRLEDGIIVYANPRFEKMFGYEPGEMIGKDVSIVNAPSDEKAPQETKQAIIDILVETGEWSGEVKNIKKDGTRFWCKANVTLFDHPDFGKVIVAVHTDITKQKLAETALHESEQKFRTLFDQAGDYILILEPCPDGPPVIIDANQAAIEKHGYRRDEFIGMPVSSLDDEENRKRVTERTKRLLAGEHILFETNHIRKDGSIFPVEVSSKMFMPKQGPPLFVSVERDITWRKQSEKLLRDSHERLLTVLNSLDAIVYVADMETHEVLFANKYTQDHFGPVTGKLCWQVLQHGQSGVCDFCTNKYLLDENGIPCDPYIWEFQNTATGQWLNVNDRAIQWLDGQTVRLEIAIDITDRKQAEEVLRNAHDELEKAVRERTLDLQKTHEQLLHAEKMSTIGNLSASIAHEFNNPLQGVLGIIRGVKRRAELSNDDTELVDIAITECNRMKDLIKSLQDFNRPTSSRKAPMNLHNALDSILLLANKQFQTRKITVEKKYAEDLPQIMAVADQLKQVFLNLLNNASDACVQGGEITIGTDRWENNVVIRFHDTGSGIIAENKEHIFEPFFTTKATMKGTGLGLPVSYGIIKDHGGKITVESEPGKGTTFSVVLPIEGNSDAEQ